MYIRQSHPIRDRIRVLLVLFLLLVVFLNLAKIVQTNGAPTKNATVEELLKNAMHPVGKTMYIWGGGWEAEEKESGGISTQMGVSEKWIEFTKEQDENYDFNDHRFEREKGLDCSGYVGWVLYNTFETMEGKSSYVTLSTDVAKSLASRGWGKLIKNPKEFLPGDIVSMEGHVWICLGSCEDGSVLLAHSSPPGVSVCGTGQQSMAVQLATTYMTEKHPQWQEKYPDREVSTLYLEDVVLFRWSKYVMPDAPQMQEKSAEEILEILSPDM